MKGLGYRGIWGQNWKPGHYQPKEGLYNPQHPLDNSVLFFFQQLQNTAGSVWDQHTSGAIILHLFSLSGRDLDLRYNRSNHSETHLALFPSNAPLFLS